MPSPAAVALAVVLVTLPVAAESERPLEATEPWPVENADPSAERLLRQPYPATDDSLRDAFVYLPTGYATEPDRQWPILLFLHGNGERGDGRDDLDWLLAEGPLYEAWVQKRDLPFVIVAPQLPLFGFEKTVDYIRERDPSTIPKRRAEGVPPRPEPFSTPQAMNGIPADVELPFGSTGPPKGWHESEAELLALLDLMATRYRTDPSRVYLTGLSYGGFGTWYLASKHPDRFAAIVPVAGWGHPELMRPLAERLMPVWAFAGGRDSAILVQHFYAGLNALEALGHDNVRFTVHEDRGHDVWRRVYASRDLYDWLLTQRSSVGRERSP